MSVTIAATAVPNWQRDNDVVLRIYALASFVAADGTEIVGGDTSMDSSSNSNWFQSLACTITNNQMHIPAVTLPSTTDSVDNPQAAYCALLFTTEGDLISPYGQFVRFVLPPLPASTTWAAIAALSQSANAQSAVPSFFFAGAWTGSKLYGVGNATNHNYSLWYALVATTGEEPGTGSSWALMLQGQPGTQGLKGDSGSTLPNFTQKVSAPKGLAVPSGAFSTRFRREFPLVGGWTNVVVGKDVNGRSRLISGTRPDGTQYGIVAQDARVPAGAVVVKGAMSLPGTTVAARLYVASDVVTPSQRRWYPNVLGLDSIRLGRDVNGRLRLIDGVRKDGTIMTGAGTGTVANATLAVSYVDPVPNLQPNALTTATNHATLTGQSLSTGSDSLNNAGGLGAGGTFITATQPFANKKFNSGVRCENGSSTALDPLTGDVDNGGAGETCANGFADRVSSLVRSFDLLHDLLMSSSGIPGQVYANICGPTDYASDHLNGSPSFQAMMAQITAGKALAPTTYAHRAVLLMHGEADAQANNAAYTANLIQWQKDIQAGSHAITGRSSIVPFLMGQCIYPLTGQQQLAAAVANPETHVLVYPAYMLQHTIVTGAVNLHLSPWGERLAGEYLARAYYRRVLQGRRVLPFVPATVTALGYTLLLKYQGNDGAIAIDTTLVTDPGNYGFSYSDANGATITAVTVLDAQTIQIKLSRAATLGTGTLGYAVTGDLGGPLGPTSGPRGCVRDSSTDMSFYPDQTGALTRMVNHALAFTLSV